MNDGLDMIQVRRSLLILKGTQIHLSMISFLSKSSPIRKDALPIPLSYFLYIQVMSCFIFVYDSFPVG